MKSVLLLAGSAVLVVLTGCSKGTSGGPTGKDTRPQDKSAVTGRGSSKIVGTWRFVRSSNNREPSWGTKLDFSSDGKVSMHAVGYANAGTYSLEKNTLTFNTAEKHMVTVAKLTDKELVLQIDLAPVPGNTATFEYRKE